jgi:hypothetical protein
MQFISILSISALALIVVVIYSVRLQRRAIATQERLALEHHEEKQKRDSFYASSEDTVETLKNATQRDEEALQLLRRSLEIQEEILRELRERAR